MKILTDETERSNSVAALSRTGGSVDGTGFLCESSRLGVSQFVSEFELSLQSRVAERTRIARELHDTLLQRFSALLLRFQTAGDLLPARPAEAKIILAQAIDQAADALTEGRERVQDLRTSADELNGLAVAIGNLRDELAMGCSGTHEVTFRVYVVGTARPLAPMVWDETYRIAAEAVRNAFVHSRGTQSEVELRYGKRQLRLRVRDDGRGIDGTVQNAGGRQGHYGLCGMRERAALVGGNLTIWSAPGAGTEVELTIPASRAYLADARYPS
jgi:signal transduction histidine kinase